MGPQCGATYLTGKLWSGLILSNKLYSCGGNVSWDHSAFLNVREFGSKYATKLTRATFNFPTQNECHALTLNSTPQQPTKKGSRTCKDR